MARRWRSARSNPSHALESLTVTIPGASPITVGSDGELDASDVAVGAQEPRQGAEGPHAIGPSADRCALRRGGHGQPRRRQLHASLQWKGGGLFGGRSLPPAHAADQRRWTGAPQCAALMPVNWEIISSAVSRRRRRRDDRTRAASAAPRAGFAARLDHRDPRAADRRRDPLPSARRDADQRAARGSAAREVNVAASAAARQLRMQRARRAGGAHWAPFALARTVNHLDPTGQQQRAPRRRQQCRDRRDGRRYRRARAIPSTAASTSGWPTTTASSSRTPSSGPRERGVQVRLLADALGLAQADPLQPLARDARERLPRSASRLPVGNPLWTVDPRAASTFATIAS